MFVPIMDTRQFIGYVELTCWKFYWMVQKHLIILDKMKSCKQKTPDEKKAVVEQKFQLIEQDF